MPTYEYECNSCGARFERFQPITEKPLPKCLKCGKISAKRIIHGGAGLIFKGTGFYQTDHRSKSYAEDAKKDKPEEKKSTGKDGSCSPPARKQPDVCFPDKKKK